MKKITLLTIFFCFVLGAFAQKGFYDLDKIQDIKIVFGYADWDAKLDAQKAGAQDYIIALSCTINGEKFDSVGVKYKGNSSYSATRKKNPLHIKLDWKKNQNYNGVTSIKMSNIFADPSYIREPLSYKLLGDYMDCPRANFAKVYVENKYYGVMTNVEPINNKFVGEHFGSSENTFIKCNPKFGGGVPPGGSNVPTLIFLTYDSTKYKNIYELESKTGWYDLIKLTDTLAKKPNSLDKVLDVDRAIWMLAFNNLFVNLDSYSGAFGQNYYLYKDDNQRFIPIVWDLNMSFGSFNSTGLGGVSTNLAQLKADLHSGTATRPLIKAIFANSTYKKMYYAHMRTMLKECFVNKKYETEAIAMRTFIEPEVKTDVNPLSTYAQFQTGMTATGAGGAPGQNVRGISNLMEARVTYLLAQTEFTAATPVISNVDFSPKSAKKGDDIWITAKIEDLNNAVVAYREDSEDIFTKVQLYDDGAHQDGAANDGVFGASLKAKDFKMQYYIYAENANTGIFAPERAEHEFYKIELQNAGTSSVAIGDLVINELMPANKITAIDPTDTASDDWAEIFNNSTQELSLDNLYLTDDFAQKDKWQFPTGIKIPAKGRLIVWLDEDGKAVNGFHASFKLSASGEQLMLAKADGTVLDSLSFKATNDDNSLERCPDGTGAFAMTAKPTFNSQNCKPLSATNASQITDYQVFPNPFTNILTIEGEGIQQVEITTINGQRLLSQKINETSQHQISMENFDTGIYILKINQNVVRKIIKN